MTSLAADVVTFVVGAEHDEEAFARLEAALASVGALPEDGRWGVAGSQEVSTWTLTLDGEALVVEAETYAGLSVTGGRVQVVRIRQALESSGEDHRPPIGTS